MWRAFLIACAIAGAMLALTLGKCAAECLPSAQAVWSAHKGAHADWSLQVRGHRGEKCWFVKDLKNVETRVAIPLPRPAPRQVAVLPPDPPCLQWDFDPASFPVAGAELRERYETAGFALFLRSSRQFAAGVRVRLAKIQ